MDPENPLPPESETQPSGSVVQQARASITALTSLFEDPVTLKPKAQKAQPSPASDPLEIDPSLVNALLTVKPMARPQPNSPADPNLVEIRRQNEVVVDDEMSSTQVADSERRLDPAPRTAKAIELEPEALIFETSAFESAFEKVSPVEAIAPVTPTSAPISAPTPAQIPAPSLIQPPAPTAESTIPAAIPAVIPAAPAIPNDSDSVLNDSVLNASVLTSSEIPSVLSTPLPPDQQVRIKREEGYVSLIFPIEQASANPDINLDFVDSELWQQLQKRLSGSERYWSPNTPVHLNARNHLLDGRQLQDLSEALEQFELKLTRIATSRRQTAVAAVTAGFSVDQGSELPELLPAQSEAIAPSRGLAAEPLYLQTTVRSGTEIRHPGSVILMGDLNPGSSVIADGDILIWGRLRGLAHAGAAGERRSIIMALKLEPAQLRIADAVARVPESAKGTLMPEVAYITPRGDIRITDAASFTRPSR